MGKRCSFGSSHHALVHHCIAIARARPRAQCRLYLVPWHTALTSPSTAPTILGQASASESSQPDSYPRIRNHIAFSALCKGRCLGNSSPSSARISQMTTASPRIWGPVAAGHADMPSWRPTLIREASDFASAIAAKWFIIAVRHVNASIGMCMRVHAPNGCDHQWCGGNAALLGYLRWQKSKTACIPPFVQRIYDNMSCHGMTTLYDI